MSTGKRITTTSERSAADRRAMLSRSSVVAADDDNNSEYGLVRGGGIVLKRGRRSTELRSRRRYVGGDADEDRGHGDEDESADEIAAADDGASGSDYETADGGSESDYETDGAGSDSGDSPLRSGDGIALKVRLRCICVSDGESSVGETTDDSTAAAADG